MFQKLRALSDRHLKYASNTNVHTTQWRIQAGKKDRGSRRSQMVPDSAHFEGVEKFKT